MRLLDPTLDAERSGGAMAPRLASLRGRTVGLLSNGKIGTSAFFARLAERLVADCGVQRVIRDEKPDMSRSAPAQVIARLRGLDAVITGLGD